MKIKLTKVENLKTYNPPPNVFVSQSGDLYIASNCGIEKVHISANSGRIIVDPVNPASVHNLVAKPVRIKEIVYEEIDE
jgi:hypothetical protein